MQVLLQVKDVLEILSYIAILFGIPVGLYQFREASRREQKDREYGTYNALDEKYLDFLRLCFENPDLDVFDVPRNPPRAAGEHDKRELVAFTMLISILERAYLMYSDQRSEIIERQWSGWRDYIEAFCRRVNFRSAWLVCGQSFDLRFQDFLETTLLEVENADDSADIDQNILVVSARATVPTSDDKETLCIRIVQSPLEPEFIQAVQLCSALLPPSPKVSSNTLAFLLDGQREGGQRILFFSLKYGRRVVGAAELVYLPEHRMIVVAGFCIDSAHRRRGAFFRYVCLLLKALSSLRLEYDRIVAELPVPTQSDSVARRRYQLQLRLLRLVGFRALPNHYLTPAAVGVTVEARLLVRGRSAHERRLDTFENLATALYNRYHGIWFSAFPSVDKMAQPWLRAIWSSLMDSAAENPLPNSDEREGEARNTDLSISCR